MTDERDDVPAEAGDFVALFQDALGVVVSSGANDNTKQIGLLHSDLGKARAEHGKLSQRSRRLRGGMRRNARAKALNGTVSNGRAERS